MSGTRGRWGGGRAIQEQLPGFTLVELLVVIGIISLLTAFLLPTLNKAKAQANNLACQANLRQIGEAIQFYVGSSKGVLPFGYWDGAFNLSSGVDTGYDGRYAADWSVLVQSAISANAGGTYNSNFAGGLYSQVRGIFMDPDAPLGETRNSFNATLTQYACHPRLMPKLGDRDKFAEMGGAGGVKSYLRPYKIARIRRSCEVALVFDASLAPALGGGWSVSVVPVAESLDNGRLNSDTFLTDQYGVAATAGFNADEEVDMTPAMGGRINSDDTGNPQNIRFRHMNNRICNVLMADMHVESVGVLQRANINMNP